MKADIEQVIKREIEFMFGRKIVLSKDCVQLSEEIFRVTKAQLSPNTLRRFFGIVKTDYAASVSTLQILCNYCGFPSIEDLKNFRHEKIHEIESPEQKNLLNFLVNIFSETPVKNGSSDTFNSVVKQTIFFVNRLRGLIDQFQSSIAKTKNGQDFYFEGFVHIDELHSFYGDGLRYYLREKNDRDAQLFGHSLLMYRYWLTEDDVHMEQQYRYLKSVASFPVFGNKFPGRYFAALLFYENAKKMSSSKTILAIQDYFNNMHPVEMIDQVQVEIQIAEALILTGNYEEGKFHSDRVIKKMLANVGVDEPVLQHAYLLYAFALLKSGDIKTSEQTYERVKPSAFNFLSKKMQTILYGLLMRGLMKLTDKAEDQVDLLIAETGFIRLRKLSGTNNEYI